MNIWSQMTGAFFGAFAAYCLVIVTDKMRARKKKANFDNLIDASLSMARTKLKSVREISQKTQDSSKQARTHFIPFSLTVLKKAESEVIDSLRMQQILSIDAIYFTMCISDKILDDIITKVERIRMLNVTSDKGTSERVELEQQVTDDYRVAIESINKVIRMLEFYKDESYGQILTVK